ncbi:MAG TPA: type II secretion system protein [Tepidisphaeraceae bacterium]|nr:type II secretion system protein [Tepidisphaeraceae bacterium]
MSDSPPQPPKARRWRLSAVEVIVLIGIVALLVSIAMPSLNRRRELKLAYAAQRGCPRALNGLAMALTMHQQANGGAVPQDLDALQKAVQKEMGPDTWRLFTCPYASARGHRPCAPGAVCDTWYVYCVPPAVTTYSQVADPGRAVCAYEPLANHDGSGIMVLYWDGHVTWHDAAEARRIIAEVEAGHNPPREEMLKSTNR